MPLQPPSTFCCPWQKNQSAFFPSKILCVVYYILIGNRVRVKSSGIRPRGWQMPGPRTAQNLQKPHPRDWQGGQIPCSSPGGLGAAGIGWWITHELLAYQKSKGWDFWYKNNECVNTVRSTFHVVLCLFYIDIDSHHFGGLFISHLSKMLKVAAIHREMTRKTKYQLISKNVC